MAVIKRPRAQNLNIIDVSHIIQVEKPDVKFQDIIGCETAKSFLRDFGYALKEEDNYYQTFGCETPKNILLYGSHGNGKNSLATALCYNTNALFYNIKITDIINKWFSESERNIEAIFTDACRRSREETKPIILYFSNLDALFCPPDMFSRDGLSLRLCNVLCEIMESNYTKYENIHILGRAKKIENISKDVLSMFFHQFEIKKPDLKERVKLLEKCKKSIYEKCLISGNNWISVDFEQIAQNTDGYSCLSIKNIFNEILRKKAIAWKASSSTKIHRDNTHQNISTEDFLKIIPR